MGLGALFGRGRGEALMTARQAEEAAREHLASASQAPSVYLCDVSVWVDEPIEPDGRSRCWYVHYYSPSENAVLEVCVARGKAKGPKRLKAEKVATAWSLYPISPPPEEIPPGWMDSSEAVKSARETAEGEVRPRVGKLWDDYHIQVLGLPAAHCALLYGGGALLSRPEEPRIRTPVPSELCWIVIFGHVDIEDHPAFAYFVDAQTAQVRGTAEFSFG